jgi:hypothetical protein
MADDILDYCWSKDVLAVDVFFPEQDTTGGTIQLLVAVGAPFSDPDEERLVPGFMVNRTLASRSAVRPKDLRLCSTICG